MKVIKSDIRERRMVWRTLTRGLRENTLREYEENTNAWIKRKDTLRERRWVGYFLNDVLVLLREWRVC